MFSRRPFLFFPKSVPYYMFCFSLSLSYLIAHTKPAETPSTPSAEDYLMDEDDYNNEYDDENAGSAKEDNNVNLTPPKMTTTWTMYVADIGDRVKIQCPVIDLGQDVILWYRGTEMLAQDKIAINTAFEVDSNRSLIIRSVDSSNVGDYTCKLEPSQQLSTGHLDVRQAPTVKITDGLRDIMDRTMTYREGEKIRLVCEGLGFPKPELSWDTKHHRLSDMSGVITDKGDLVIENAEPHHSGIYECRAVNEKKETAHASVHIVIECKWISINSNSIPLHYKNINY